MVPTLHHGDFVAVAKWRSTIKESELVVVSHPEFGVLVKRVRKQEDGGYWLQSDNPAGTSSSKIGRVSPENIVGRVLFSIRNTPAKQPDNLQE